MRPPHADVAQAARITQCHLARPVQAVPAQAVLAAPTGPAARLWPGRRRPRPAAGAPRPRCRADIVVIGPEPVQLGLQLP